MRVPLLILCLAAAMPAPAQATDTSCTQLRLTVRHTVPAISRDLPYHRLDCHGISEVFLLTIRSDEGILRLNRQIEAVFRRNGLIG